MRTKKEAGPIEGKVFVRDLADISDPDYNKRRGELILCEVCGTEFGGTRGDYFMQSMDYAFSCPSCGNDAELYLVRRVSSYEYVHKDKWGG